jgi:cyanophycinase-like exopeptidase
MTERTRSKSKGPLIIIGGGEDKEGKRTILREVASHLDGGRLVLATVASHEPEGYFEAYEKAFADLGITDLVEVYVKIAPRPSIRRSCACSRVLPACSSPAAISCASRARSATRPSSSACGRSMTAAACSPEHRPVLP